VVYRHPSPGLASDSTPVLAISSGSGFNARTWMTQAEVQEVAKAGEVQFALENAVLKKYFVGQFRKAEEVPYESRLLAHFDATLPIEAIAGLGTGGEPLKVKLLWRPPMLADTWFRSGLVVILLGLLMLCLSSITARVRAYRTIRLTPVAINGGIEIIDPPLPSIQSGNSTPEKVIAAPRMPVTTLALATVIYFTIGVV
jgi:hypothetical protein